MLKYAQISNEETKECNVGVGDNIEFYKSIGMTEMEVEQAYNGSWYVKGYCPEKPQELIDEELSQQLRSKRDSLLSASDWTQLPDSPLSQEQKTKWTQYRQYLRDIPQQEEFPNIEIKSFEEFQQEEE